MTGIYIILGWVFVGWIGLLFFYFRRGARMTSSTTGTITSTSVRTVKDRHGRRVDETLVVCQFQTQGRQFELTQAFPGSGERLALGRQLPIRYNPADPNMAMISTR